VPSFIDPESEHEMVRITFYKNLLLLWEVNWKLKKRDMVKLIRKQLQFKANI
jgi:hypothetical protein